MKFQEESGIVEFAEAGKVLNMLADKINKLKIDKEVWIKYKAQSANDLKNMISNEFDKIFLLCK